MYSQKANLGYLKLGLALESPVCTVTVLGLLLSSATLKQKLLAEVGKNSVTQEEKDSLRH